MLCLRAHAVIEKDYKRLDASQRATAECETSSFAASCVWGSGSEQDTSLERHGMLVGKTGGKDLGAVVTMHHFSSVIVGLESAT